MYLRAGISNPRPTEIPLLVNEAEALSGISWSKVAFSEILWLKTVLEPRYRAIEVTVTSPPENSTLMVFNLGVSFCGLVKGKKAEGVIG